MLRILCRALEWIRRFRLEICRVPTCFHTVYWLEGLYLYVSYRCGPLLWKDSPNSPSSMSVVCRTTISWLPYANGVPVKKQALKVLTQSFQSEIRPYVDNIKSKAENVKQEIQLAKVKSVNEEQHLQSEERKEAASSRKQILTLFSKSRAEIGRHEEQGKKRAEGKSD